MIATATRELTYKAVPKARDANMAYRKDLWQWGASSPSNAAELLEASARDPLFFINAFLFTFDPRELGDETLPFITYEHQDHYIEEVERSIGKYNTISPKSRTQGATWIVLSILFRRWLLPQFKRQTFLVASRNDEMVDFSDNPDCLFWKLDFLFNHIPAWMRPAHKRTKKRLTNQDTGQLMSGTATTKDIARGGRRTAVYIDEFASFERGLDEDVLKAASFVSNSVIFSSTPNGNANAFAIIVKERKAKRIDLDWKDHPVQSIGRYQSVNGSIQFIDKEFWDNANMRQVRDMAPLFVDKHQEQDVSDDAPARLHYPFVTDDWPRAPYYDEMDLKMPSRRATKQELDIDFAESGGMFFESSVLQKCKEDAEKPYAVGDWDYEHGEFNARQGGRFKLWLNLEGGLRPPDDRTYVIGCDISTGSGASKSCMSVGDLKTKRKVAKFTTRDMRSGEFAEFVDSVGRWFSDENGRPAKIAWELQGPGGDFGMELQERSYPNLYYYVNKKGRRSEDPGWPSNDQAKMKVLEGYARALKNGDVINPDEAALEECQYYVYDEGGKVVWDGPKTDGSGEKGNHGDEAMADTLMCFLMRGEKAKKQKEARRIVPRNSMAFRNRWHEQQTTRRGRW